MLSDGIHIGRSSSQICPLHHLVSIPSQAFSCTKSSWSLWFTPLSLANSFCSPLPQGNFTRIMTSDGRLISIPFLLVNTNQPSDYPRIKIISLGNKETLFIVLVILSDLHLCMQFFDKLDYKIRVSTALASNYSNAWHIVSIP